MRVTTTDQAKTIINTALRLANWGPIRSTIDLRMLFFKIAKVGNIDLVRDSLTKDKQVYESAQAELRGWLKEITEKRGRARVTIGPEISRYLGKVAAVVSFKQEGPLRYRLVYEYVLHGVPAACAFAVGLILDEARGLTNRLGYCKVPDCGKFRLDFKGKPWSYCNEEHRFRFNEFDAKHRMKEMRKRKAKQEKEAKHGASRR